MGRYTWLLMEFIGMAYAVELILHWERFNTLGVFGMSGCAAVMLVAAHDSRFPRGDD